jgi:UDP-N-acetylglucosamine 4-epimerase
MKINKYHETKKYLKKNKYVWLVTGVAGFIGSNLLEELLSLNQKVIGIDDFSNGSIKNLNEVRRSVLNKQWINFKFIKGDLSEIKICKKAINKNVDFVLHQAARGSVLKSILDPIKTNNSNVTGFLNILYLSKEYKIKSFVYASSSAVYGDSKFLPKKETKVGNLLSNYALTKKINENYAELFFRQYNFKTVGLRYFNVFGKRQDPNGDYAAVVPRWIRKAINAKTVVIFGDGKTSRDFTHVSNVVQANILAALKKLPVKNHIFNTGTGCRITLNKLILTIYKILKIKKSKKKIKYQSFRQGDIRHSLASIENIKKKLEYNVGVNFTDSLKLTINYYLNQK